MLAAIHGDSEMDVAAGAGQAKAADFGTSKPLNAVFVIGGQQ